MSDKLFIRHIGLHTTAGIPVTPKREWPDFPEAQKPSNNSPFRTVLWFHKHINNGVRILIEGRDKAAVDAYAKLVTSSTASSAPTQKADGRAAQYVTELEGEVLAEFACVAFESEHVVVLSVILKNRPAISRGHGAGPHGPRVYLAIANREPTHIAFPDYRDWEVCCAEARGCVLRVCLMKVTE